MRTFLSILLGGVAWTASIALVAGEVSPPRIKAYYTRLPFDDHRFTGRYADIVVELPQRGRCVFSREFGYQLYGLPVGGKQPSVARLIPRKGHALDERSNIRKIACKAAIVAQTDSSVTVHWRYANAAPASPSARRYPGHHQVGPRRLASTYRSNVASGL